MDSSTIDDDWEEWDGVSPFWHHCLAGSAAGLAEHTLIYPLDTVRTHIQVCANCNKFSPSSYQAAEVALQNKQEAVTKIGSSSSSSLLHPHGTTAAAARTTTTTTGRPLTYAASTATTAKARQQLPTGMWQTMRYLVSEPVVMVATTTAADSVGTAASSSSSSHTMTAAAAAARKPEGLLRLWRGVQTMMIGCIPAHAIYFSSYEMVKAFWQNNNNNHNHNSNSSNELVWYGSMMAGATATIGHDMIMAPLDTVKQRLQIGHYQGSMSYALRQMINKEGPVALYRSFPITLLANVPYGMIMVTTNETLKDMFTRTQPLTLTTTLLASSAAGLVASAATTPLDRIKTLLQTQQMAPACWPTPPANCPIRGQVNVANVVNKTTSSSADPLVLQNAWQACQHILRHEGPVGLFRGLVPRVMSHTPAVAISWTTYETAKSILWNITTTN